MTRIAGKLESLKKSKKKAKPEEEEAAERLEMI